ncbi:hypothetical protein BBK36DRAFT_1117598 [Trichoderma citrinoviride]|uniref:CBM-cenC domain-containing protein n=1 Tax=Trichoderma citrinoviride TaxID=58853 RepID=A0A2T4BBZ6_9HYPO|nr:hypothetical protein BBK36DRAFT_1117598 [Trichoderma citrinoviride]PTB66808.1 hypothetical protein BBK36DRAFT_1117598 [Trichoderma citrinoviride]
MMNKIVVGALGLVAGVAATPLELAERSSCRDDSLYRCFVDAQYSASASAYCSALDPTIRTVTAAPPAVTTTVWTTITADMSTDSINSRTTIYTVTVPSSTEIATETDTETVTITTTVSAGAQTKPPSPPATVTITSQQPAKRDNGAPQPSCMVKKCFIYSPERITAACSCINVPPETITITQPGTATTETVTSTSTETPIITATAWETVSTELVDGVTTTTTTVTSTSTATKTATASPSASNVVPNGDFSSGLTGWSIINTAPTAWVNAGVSTSGSPDGISNAYHITNVQNSGLAFLGSPTFGVDRNSVYRLSFLVDNSATDSSWVAYTTADVACGSMTLVSVGAATATEGPNGYRVFAADFNTPTAADSSTLAQLRSCQVQVVFHSAPQLPNTWFLADVSVTYVGPLSSAP